MERPSGQLSLRRYLRWELIAVANPRVTLAETHIIQRNYCSDYLPRQVRKLPDIMKFATQKGMCSNFARPLADYVFSPWQFTFLAFFKPFETFKVTDFQAVARVELS